MAFLARASGAPDPVHVIFGVGRDVKVEHVAQVFHVEAARGDVGTDQDVELFVFESGQHFGACGLAHVAMQLPGADAALGERFVNRRDIGLAIAKHQRVGHVFVTDQLVQRFAFELLLAVLALVLRAGAQRQQALGHRIGGGGGRGHGNDLRVHQEFVGQFFDFRGHGGREEQGLTDRRQHRDDFFDVGNKAHVEHAIGFVDDQNFHVAHQQVAAFEHVEQAARRGDQHVCAAVQNLGLFLHVGAADEQRLGQSLVVLAIGVEVVGNLGGQFAGRFQNQRPRHAHFCAPVGQNVNHRQGERRGLAGAGLGAGQNVAAHEDRGDGCSLNGGGGFVSCVFNGAQDVFA